MGCPRAMRLVDSALFQMIGKIRPSDILKALRAYDFICMKMQIILNELNAVETNMPIDHDRYRVIVHSQFDCLWSVCGVLLSFVIYDH